jgi:transmembrane sensor
MTRASAIEAQAAEWLARRDAAEDPSEGAAEFAAWLAADTRHRAAYLRLAAAWERSGRLKMLRSESEPVNPDLFAPPSSGWRHWRGPLAVAASVAVAAVVAGAWLNPNRGVETYRTEVGGLARVVLKDGSTVTLNTDTELKFRLLPERREIKLIRGEAQFAVAHDVKRPFEVSAAGRIVRAVGTAFDVRLHSGEGLEVTVTEGRVALLDAAGFATPEKGVAPAPTIAAGEAAVSSGRHVTVRRVSATETSRRLAWEVGELSFQGETLAEAVAEFNRYNRRKLAIGDPEIAGLQVGGNFQALDVDSFVAALARSFGVAYRTNKDGTLVLERAAQPIHD